MGKILIIFKKTLVKIWALASDEWIAKYGQSLQSLKKYFGTDYMDMLSSVKHPMCSIQEEQQCAWLCKTIQPMLTEGIDRKLKIKLLLNIFPNSGNKWCWLHIRKEIIISNSSESPFPFNLHRVHLCEISHRHHTSSNKSWYLWLHRVTRWDLRDWIKEACSHWQRNSQETFCHLIWTFLLLSTWVLFPSKPEASGLGQAIRMPRKTTSGRDYYNERTLDTTKKGNLSTGNFPIATHWFVYSVTNRCWCKTHKGWHSKEGRHKSFTRGARSRFCSRSFLFLSDSLPVRSISLHIAILHATSIF